MSNINRDRSAWHEAALDTPFATPPSGLTHDEALTTPGCYVKTRKAPELLGRLVKIDRDVVTVRSNEPYHDGKGNPFVWTGSLPEYFTMWRCD